MAGDSIIRKTERSWADFAAELRRSFGERYKNQNDVLNFLTGKLTDLINNPQGFSPAAMAGLRGNAADTIARQFQFARQSAGNSFAANGSFGSQVGSGVNAQIGGQLAGAQAGAMASALGNIALSNEQQKLENQRFGIGALGNVAALEDPQGFSGQATNAAGTVGSLGKIYHDTDSGGFGDMFKGALGSALGKGLAGGLFGGLSGGLSGIMPGAANALGGGQ